MLSGVDDDFASRATEQHFHTVQHVSTQDALVAAEIRLESTRVGIAVKVGPGRKDDGRNGRVANAAH